MSLLRPTVLLCHSALSVASSLVMGKRGEVDLDDVVFDAVCDVLSPALEELELGSNELPGVRCMLTE